MADFNFITEPASVPTLSEAEYVGPNLKSAVKMTPRKFASSVLEVFEKLGGTSWLLSQAIADPKAFLDLLKKLIPKNVQLDNLAGFQVNLIDQFGNEIQIATGDTSTGKGQPSDGIATGGNLPLDPPSSTGREDISEQVCIELKETF